MALTATSALAASPGGATTYGVFAAAALVFLIAYRELLTAADGEYRTLRVGLVGMTVSLTTTFVAVVLVQVLAASSAA